METDHNIYVSNDVISSTNENKTEDFFQHYMLGKTIGGGNFSSVRMCVAKTSLEKFAVKCVNLKDVEQHKAREKEVRQEVDIIKKLSHNNMIKCIDAFFDEDEIMIVLEYAEHGDLYELIAECGFMPESRAKAIGRQILEGVNYLHSINIVHRDVKPENFLIFYDNIGDIKVKLCDFGLALEVVEPITEVCGSPSYVAPEILRLQSYGLTVDMWSCGVVLYIVLVQFPPFKGENNKELFSAIIQGKYDFPEPYWSDISDNCKDLIRRLLKTSPEARIKSDGALKHIWFQDVDNVPSPVKKKSSHRVSLRVAALAIRSVSRFRKTAVNREEAVLSSEMVKESLQGNSCSTNNEDST